MPGTVENWFFALFGLFGGISFSVVFWFALNHYFVPAIKFSPELSRRYIDYDNQNVRDQFAFKNVGKRAVINIKIKVRLAIPDPRKIGSNITNFYNLHLINTELFQLKPGRMVRMAPLPHLSTSLDTTLLDTRLHKKREDGSLTLSDIFDIYPESFMYVQLIGTDVYSHATKVFVSQHYKKGDARLGVFRGRDLNVKQA